MIVYRMTRHVWTVGGLLARAEQGKIVRPSARENMGANYPLSLLARVPPAPMFVQSCFQAPYRILVDGERRLSSLLEYTRGADCEGLAPYLHNRLFDTLIDVHELDVTHTAEEVQRLRDIIHAHVARGVCCIH